jgi:hypothetical protein
LISNDEHLTNDELLVTMPVILHVSHNKIHRITEARLAATFVPMFRNMKTRGYII